MDPGAIKTYAALEDSYWWFVGRREIIRRLMAATLPGGMRILDWGCGPGGNYQMLSQFGHVTAVDASDESLAFCRERGIPDVVKANTLADFPPGEPYDLVTTFDVLEHIDDDVGFLRDLRPRLKDGGHVLVSVPAYQFLWSDLDRLLGHVRRYSRPALVRRFEEAGYTVRTASYFNMFVAAPFILVRWLQARSGKTATLKEYAMDLPAWLNGILIWLEKIESVILPRVSLPFGSSVIVLARK